jgi:rhodanese-related sulfurtransferase
VRRLLLEAVLVAAVGAVVAFAANALSPRGLKLTRDFFGSSSHPLTNSVPGTNATPGLTTTNAAPLELLAARLREKGLHLAGSNQVIELFKDPRCQQGLVIFVDAREDRHYQEGHIPGAYQLDYYRPEAYLAALLPLCQLAQQIVVYCNGGTCEDSEFAATFLLSAGVAKEKLLVYGGGVAEWTTNGLPVELGPRLSGQMRTEAVK